MLSFILIDDPDRDRRDQASRAGARLLADDSRISTTALERGSVALVWGLGPATPFDRHTGEQHEVLFIGEPIAGPGQEPISAAAQHRVRPAEGPRPTHDGLYLAITVSDTGEWSVAADLLGILPVYYTVTGDVRLVASSPGLLRAHPAFQESLDVIGLTSLLVTNGLIGGETIIRGVRRLAAGHALCFRPGTAPAEVLHYRIPVTTRHHDLPIAECSYRLHEALVAACRRQVRADRPHALLLSGGLDSRLLAGVLAGVGVPIIAITRGLSTDNDARCARRVARHLGFPHRLAADETGRWADFDKAIRRDGMVTSPGLGGPGIAAALGGGPTRAVSGYLMDAIVGGSHIRWCYSDADHASSFDAFLRRLNYHGIRIDTLRRLLRPEIFGDSVDIALERVRSRYEALGDSHFERAWRFDLEHRQRFQIGGMLLRQMHAAWPVAPHIDREVLAVAGGVPLELLSGRTIERDMLIRFHRGLARLPLDRGTEDTTPLEPDVGELLRSLPDRVVRRVREALGMSGSERRYYHRIFDLDGPGWRDIRRGAESAREAAYAWFDRATFDALLPPVGTPWPPEYRLVDSVGRKLLLGAAARAAHGG